MEMIRKSHRFASGLTILLASHLCAWAAAQESGESQEDYYELSPFTVEADETAGYRATSTLSGTRIRSSLEDIASSISVVTREFLEDTNSTNALETLVYTTGTEVAGVGGNFTAFELSGGSAQVNDQGSRNSIESQTRIRGLAGADRARDYFATSIPFDSYNTERIEINRGSNAVLFGLGSPAGIINNSLRQPIFTDRNEVGLTIGSYGSARGTLDINREIVDDQLAVRVMALHDRKKFEQEPAFERDERLHLAAKYQRDFSGSDSDAWGRTTVRGSFESGRQEANRPRTIPISDFVTPWFEPWDVDVLGELNMPVKITWNGAEQGTNVWPNRPISDPDNPYPDNARISHQVVDGYFRGISMIFQEPTASGPSDPYGNGVIGRQGISNRVVGSATGVFMKPTDLNTALRDYRPALPYAAFYSTPTLSDRSLFDFRKQLIDGPNKYENFDFDVQNVFIEQLLFGNKMGFELAFAKEQIDQEYGGILQAGSRTGLTVDINTVLMDGTPNTNFGRTFVSGSGYWGGLSEERNDFRATVFGELDFADSGSEILSWLGRHTLTGVYSDTSEDRFTFSGVPLTSGRDNIWGRSQSIGDSHGRRVGSVHYLGATLADRSSPRGANIPRIQALQMPSIEVAEGGIYRLAGNGLDNQNAPQGVFQNVSVSLIENAVDGATRTSRDVESLAFVLQSQLLNDLFVPTVAWRQDDLNSRARGAPERDADGVVITDFPLIDDDPLLNKDSSWNYGAVLKAPPSWLRKLGGVSGFNLHYGESENFQPARVRYNPDGSVIGSPSGETTDYGITLAMFEDKLVLRATRYETKQVDVTASGVGSLNFFANVHGRILTYTQQGDNPNLDPSDPGPEFDFNNDGVIDLDYQSPPQDYLDRVGFSYDPVNGPQITGGIPATAIQDLETEGIEIELVYNVRPNWNIMVNAYQQEAISNNAAATFREFVNTPAYDLDGDGTLETDWETAFSETYKDIVSNTSLNTVELDALSYFNGLRRVEALDGQKNPELREWRFNAVSNYRFQEGPLQGFNVGGAVRWEDESAIGYALTEIGGEYTIDTSEAFFGGSETNIDFWVGYTRKIMNDRAEWKVQLNVRNLMNEDDLIPIKANPDGSVIAWRIPAPREFSLRNTIEF